MVRLGYAENGLVDLDYNDGECMIFGVKSYCYNPYLGTNYMVVKERQGATENCSYLPTRKTVIDGQIITHQDGVHNAFLSHDYKVVLKLTEKVSVCACEETWKTNYDSLLVRIIKPAGCSELPSKMLPPAAVNIEKHVNVKMVRLKFIFYLVSM